MTDPNYIDISEISVVPLLIGLFNAAKAPAGREDDELTADKAIELFNGGQSPSFDQILGREIHVDLRGGVSFDPTAYDSHNGAGLAQKVVDSLKVQA